MKAALALVLTGVVVLTLLVIVVAGTEPPPCGGGVTPGGGPVDVLAAASPVALSSDPGGLTAGQRANAAAIVGAGKGMGVPDTGIVVALATGLHESKLRNLANDGTDPRLQPDQRDVARSLQLPNDGIGRDHGSVGILQQQYPWWGPLQDLMTPAVAAQKFYAKLLMIPSWGAMPTTVAAQTVQQSATPTAYTDDEPLARALFAQLSGTAPIAPTVKVGDATGRGTTAAGGVTSCPVVAVAGVGSGPALAAGFPAGNGVFAQPTIGTLTSPFGARGGAVHLGVDIANTIGTPIVAATAGVVINAGAASGFGLWVRVRSADGTITVYGHIDTFLVQVGDRVDAGQLIATVGNRGVSSGPHLHFEVLSPDGQNVDPAGWLAARGFTLR